MTNRKADEHPPVDVERNGRLIADLFGERTAALRGIARRYGIAADQIDDVLQSAVVSVLQAYRGPSDADQLFSYTAAAIRTTAAKAHRRHQRKESHLVAMSTRAANDIAGTEVECPQIDHEASDPADLVIAREETRDARARLHELPQLERTILALGAAGFGNAEIAAAVGLSERALRKRVTRAHKHLRDHGQ